MVTPYKDTTIAQNKWVREFSDSINQEELEWHRDHHTRKIIPLSGENWKIQLDNQLPRPLLLNEEITIPAKEFHRLIIGSGTLKILIQEY